MSFSGIPWLWLFKRFFAADGRDCCADSCTHPLSGYAHSRHARCWCAVLACVLREEASVRHVRRESSLVFFAPFGPLGG
jgi:hypothetical protein